MKRAYYLFNPGRMSRKDHSLVFRKEITEDGPAAPPKYLPVETVSALYIFGSIDANSALYNYLGRKHVPVHFFDYHGHYTGSFSPREYLLAGRMVVAQSKAYLNGKRRMEIARKLVRSSMFNMRRILKYYDGRQCTLTPQIEALEQLRTQAEETTTISELMGTEGNSRLNYYSAFDHIVEDFAWEGRRKRPPQNELNALVSFGNSMCYVACLDAIYNSQLNPTISYLHEPGERRYSLALDISEIFKPVLVDRLIFRLCNRRILRAQHFDHLDRACFLSPAGRKLFLENWEAQLKKTIKHRTLNRQVSYRHLLRLECYKLAKYLLGMETSYEPFRAWW